MRLMIVALLSLLFTPLARSAAPEASLDPSLPKYRVEAAEVHIGMTATDQQNLPVSDLSPADVTVLQDGQPLPIISLEQREEVPIAAAVLTDSSESMGKSVAMARESWQWMNRNMVREEDKVTFLDFDDALLRPAGNKRSGVYLTCLYDSLVRIMPKIHGMGEARRALIMFTDGVDNASYHGLQDVIEAAMADNVAIYAISTTKFKVRYNGALLEKLTRATGGRFFSIDNTDQMIFALKLIEQDLRNGYDVIFRADKNRGGLRKLAIKSARRDLRFTHQAAYYQPAISPTGPVEVAVAGQP